ncbi:helix-turn-helix domain-containing protein [Cutibacterium avidum]|uniref:helix-turn-helix domain-containing protein n=1 Tax=Cutibacterium avidum TaxID=33010 RepID=UPI003A8CA6E4
MALAESDMTVQDMADALGVTRQTIGRWMHDTAEPRRGYVLAWAMATGVDRTWLETGRIPSHDDGGSDDRCAARDSNPEPAD